VAFRGRPERMNTFIPTDRVCLRTGMICLQILTLSKRKGRGSSRRYTNLGFGFEAQGPGSRVQDSDRAEQGPRYFRGLRFGVLGFRALEFGVSGMR